MILSDTEYTKLIRVFELASNEDLMELKSMLNKQIEYNKEIISLINEELKVGI